MKIGDTVRIPLPRPFTREGVHADLAYFLMHGRWPCLPEVRVTLVNDRMVQAANSGDIEALLNMEQRSE